jgi:hypothetical protein
MSKPIFLLVTAGNCHFCTKFKNNVWINLKNTLEQEGNVQIVEIELPTTKSSISKTEYHRELYKYVSWYPTIILFPSILWNNFNSKLEGRVMNGKIDNGIVSFDIDAKIQFNEMCILDWVDSNLI